ncbi:site-specific integrase [Paenibacillus sp. FJAT-27812]|uniref:site-specific integrase n=1 Tax=Paenibacillus sp. FJAT-27812 TaxID=1684143 RepID=UPI0006A77070|nr:site-specific integrase [Paenibacillus sp. FJAT-27812]
MNLHEKKWYKLLYGRIDEQILCLANYEDEYYWDQVDERVLKYFMNKVVGNPWDNHLALSLICVYDRQLSPSSIYNLASTINARLVELFSESQIDVMSQFNYGIVEKYLSGKLIKNHSERQRAMFLSAYNSFVFNISKWITTKFTTQLQEKLLPYVFPKLPFDNRDFSVRTTAIDNAKQIRKDETSAITPLLPEIRAEGHFRWNQLKRLRTVFHTLLEEASTLNKSLPIEFNYDESEFTKERWYFIIWDTQSFGDEYNVGSKYDDFFLEFVKAEKLDGSGKGDGPWFLDILKYRLIGDWSNELLNIEKSEKEMIVNYLKQWGYEGAEDGQGPFKHRNPGLLTQGVFITRNSRNLNKILINLEPIYAACTFARFALDIFTSSGARMNELLQISYDKDCCVVTEDKKITPAKKNYIFRLIPKGRVDVENFYMPEENFRFINEIIGLLKYSNGEKGIQEVEYQSQSRKHLMTKKKYIFQYQGRHINEFTINAILRFLLHGIVIQTNEGIQVVVKSHLLRHAFATHAVQTEKLPIDIVKTLLHQKDIEITSYYAAPTQQQITESIGSLHDNWASYIDIQKGLIRGPEELREIYEDYSEKVGTQAKVVGGICTTDAVCPTRLACVGCAAKVPRPEFKDEITAYLKWAEESEVIFTEKGLLLEAKKMKISKNRAKNELKEIELVERYQRDEIYKPNIRFTNRG